MPQRVNGCALYLTGLLDSFDKTFLLITPLRERDLQSFKICGSGLPLTVCPI
jgi:hypothetical protein